MSEWETSKADQKQPALLTGKALVEAAGWLATRREQIDRADIAFISASIPDAIDFAISSADQLKPKDC
jgi:hypothetical protein